MRDLVPNFTAVGLLVNPENPNSKNQVKDIQEAAQVLGPEIKVVNASDEHGLRDASPSLSNMSQVFCYC